MPVSEIEANKAFAIVPWVAKAVPSIEKKKAYKTRERNEMMCRGKNAAAKHRVQVEVIEQRKQRGNGGPRAVNEVKAAERARVREEREAARGLARERKRQADIARAVARIEENKIARASSPHTT